MKKFIAALAISGLMIMPATAQIAISQLPSAAVPLQGNEVVAGVQNGQTVQIPETAFGIQGPASAVSGHLATFNGTTGKIIQDGGAPLTSVTCFGVAITTSGTCTTTGQIPGTATNDSASAGKVGEYISSTIAQGSAVSLVNNTSKNITSISLTAGDWDVWGYIAFTGNVATTVSYTVGSISLVADTTDTSPDRRSDVFFGNATVFAAVSPNYAAGRTRISLSSTTTVYLVGLAGFATNTMSGYGFIGARRAR